MTHLLLTIMAPRTSPIGILLLGVLGVLGVLPLLTSCSDGSSRERPPIDDSVFVSVMVDLHLVDANLALEAANTDQELPAAFTARDSVLNAHGTTRAEFEETVTWWASRPEDFLTLYEDVIERINRMSM